MNSFFTSKFNGFFIELAAHNNKEWFDANRQRYHKDVKAPFEAFIGGLIEAISPLQPGIDPDPKPHIFRINRDIRFSKDKTPYKLQRAAYLSPYGKKDPYFSGFYLQFGPEHLFFGGGVYQPAPAQLMQVRRHIANHWKEFQALTKAPAFVNYWSGLHSEDRSKRINDKDLMAFSEAHPLLLQKQFFFQNTMPAEAITSKTLLDETADRFKAALPLMQFFHAAFDEG